MCYIIANYFTLSTIKKRPKALQRYRIAPHTATMQSTGIVTISVHIILNHSTLNANHAVHHPAAKHNMKYRIVLITIIQPHKSLDECRSHFSRFPVFVHQRPARIHPFKTRPGYTVVFQYVAAFGGKHNHVGALNLR